MNKKIFSLGVCIAMGITAIVAYSLKTSSLSKNSKLIMDNVEALSSGDVSSSNYRLCYSESKIAKGYTYYDCGKCEKVYDEKGKGTYTKCFY